MKRFISVIVCVTALMCFCTAFGAASIYRYGDWTLSALSGSDDYAFAIRSYDGDDAVLTVPGDYGGYPIIGILGYAFATNTNVREVILSNHITSIGDGAFTQCENLSKIVIPDSVSEIGDNAFRACDHVVIYAYEDSYALAYAKEHEIEYVCLSSDTYLRGDSDGDGIVTIVDATIIQRKVVDIPVPFINEKAADVDGDGLDVVDATSIQRYLLDFENIHHINEIVTVFDSAQ